MGSNAIPSISAIAQCIYDNDAPGHGIPKDCTPLLLEALQHKDATPQSLIEDLETLRGSDGLGNVFPRLLLNVLQSQDLGKTVALWDVMVDKIPDASVQADLRRRIDAVQSLRNDGDAGLHKTLPINPIDMANMRRQDKGLPVATMPPCIGARDLPAQTAKADADAVTVQPESSQAGLRVQALHRAQRRHARTMADSTPIHGEYSVNAGDSFWWLAERWFGKGRGKHWRLIADANGLHGPALRHPSTLVRPAFDLDTSVKKTKKSD